MGVTNVANITEDYKVHILKMANLKVGAILILKLGEKGVDIVDEFGEEEHVVGEDISMAQLQVYVGNHPIVPEVTGLVLEGLKSGTGQAHGHASPDFGRSQARSS